MNGFSPCATGIGTVPSDPHKRVNFVHGFVLGADDLTQESTFLANRSESIARDVIGYGTVSGLRVTRELLPGGAGLVVGSGLALSPRGRPRRVARRAADRRRVSRAARLRFTARRSASAVRRARLPAVSDRRQAGAW
jgi:hypothetical protein